MREIWNMETVQKTLYTIIRIRKMRVCMRVCAPVRVRVSVDL